MAKEEDAKDREKLPKIEAVVLGQVLRECLKTSHLEKEFSTAFLGKKPDDFLI